MRAIDLYAGIGGWSLGLRLAGVEVVASYEWWKPAIATHNANHGGEFGPVNIRELDLDSLPTDIDIVVGSPPCTEFSYANRGGRGNISEGLKDLVCFFRVVDRVKPRFWAMENVPRVAEVLRHGFDDPNHDLYQFRHLEPIIEVVDFSVYGTAQARKRCIATNIPLDLVHSYRDQLPARTLGDVLTALASTDQVVDPIWGVALAADKVTETDEEPSLNAEELRMNREAKEFHPVYNNMAFPDPVGSPARTVTATCTRVSRESIVIEDPRKPGSFRRLTIRERACLQGFPITYQFFARSFAEKAKMVGNAIPPTFPYLLVQAAKGVQPERLIPYAKAGEALELPAKKAPVTLPDREGKTYPPSRGFRAAIPGLRFKSGMRFDLSNVVSASGSSWRVRFFFGSSRDIREVELDGGVLRDLRRNTEFTGMLDTLGGDFQKARVRLSATSPDALQQAWSHKASGMGPYEVVDCLGDLAQALEAELAVGVDDGDDAQQTLARIVDYVLAVASEAEGKGGLIGRGKLERYALPILAGMIVGDWFNTLDWHVDCRVAA
jgi:DNA (cytosine-5)-methyltransferase 1